LQHPVRQVRHHWRQPYRIKIKHGNQLALGKQHVARMPIAVNDLLGPGLEPKLIHTVGAVLIKARQRLGGFL